MECSGDDLRAATGADRVEQLRRWQDFGASWTVLRHEGGQVSIGLFRCDGGEEVDRFTSTDPELLDFVARSGEGHREQ